MRVLCTGLLVIFLATVAGSAFPPLAADRDVSRLFPEFAGCMRVVNTIMRSGETWEQTAVYERPGYQNTQGPNYFGCGSITLRRDANAMRHADERLLLGDPLVQKLTVRGYPAFRSVPLCGNDESLGSTSVHFDDDKVLTVHAYRGAEQILAFLETADYHLLRKAANKLELR